MSERKSVLCEKSFVFVIKIVKLYKYLTETRKEYVLSRQLLKSGTPVGALIHEAQNAESKADFIHKLAIAQKECDESVYWLELLKETEYLPVPEFDCINNEANEILKMLKSAIITTKNKQS